MIQTLESILDYHTRNVFMSWLECTVSYLIISVLKQITHISDKYERTSFRTWSSFTQVIK